MSFPFFPAAATRTDGTEGVDRERVRHVLGVAIAVDGERAVIRSSASTLRPSSHSSHDSVDSSPSFIGPRVDAVKSLL